MKISILFSSIAFAFTVIISLSLGKQNTPIPTETLTTHLALLAIAFCINIIAILRSINFGEHKRILKQKERMTKIGEGEMCGS